MRSPKHERRRLALAQPVPSVHRAELPAAIGLARITDQPLAVLALKATGKKLPNIFRKLQR
jgi:hypothetical protein